MLLELVVNATVATATAATQAMNYHMETSSLSPSSSSPLSSASSTSAAAGGRGSGVTSVVPCLSCPPYADMTDYNSSLQESGRSSDWTQSSAVETLMDITDAYNKHHGPISLTTCALGIPMNLLNIWVLTRRHMRTPVNCILTWLAVSDMLTMISYVPFALHFSVLHSPNTMSAEKNSLGWMTFIIFHSGFTGTTHTISIWLGVTLAMFRYKHIFSPAKGHITRVRRLVRARIAVFVVVVASIVVMIPNYLMNKIMQAVVSLPGTNETTIVYYIKDLHFGTPNMKPLTAVNLWMQCILAKFLPCILMVVYSGLLVRTVRMNVRMLERRHTGSTAHRRPSESYCGTRFSLAENSSDGDSGNRKSIDLGKSSKDKKKRKCKYQEMGRSQEFGASKKWFGRSKKAIENGKMHNEMNYNQTTPLTREMLAQQCQHSSQSLNGITQHAGVQDHVPEQNFLEVTEQIVPSDRHSHDSGIFSNSGHDQMSYEQQCQLNFKQKQHQLCESKKNNNSVKSSSSNTSKQTPKGSLNSKSNPLTTNSHQIHHPSQHVHQSQNERGSLAGVESGGATGGRRGRGASTAPAAGFQASTSRSQDSSRTTRMLLVVIILFLVTELPQGVLIALSVTIPGFFASVYIPLGDMMDQIALLNNGLNFLLYCIMSRDFRTTLLQRLEASPRWCLWFSRYTSSARQTDCPGFKLPGRTRKQGVLANDV